LRVLSSHVIVFFMERPVTPLSALCANVETIPEGVDLATALIAKIPPRALNESVSVTMLSSLVAELGSDDYRAQYANVLVKDTVQQPHSRWARKTAREYMGRTLVDQYNDEEQPKELAHFLLLTREIDERQFKLSKPIRWLSAITCAVALGGGTAFFTYDAAKISNHHAVEDAITFNKPLLPNGGVKIPSEALEPAQVGVAAAMGVAGTSSGALAGTFIGLSLSGRVARRRARRIVRKASE
jgi:hypothetical protein